MNYDATRMGDWLEYKGSLLAQAGAIAYDAQRGAVWQ